MTIELSGRDLGIANCDWSASGETPADVVAQMASHLRHEHGIDMPDTKAIMEGRATGNSIVEGVDDRVALIVRRMNAELDIPSSEGGTEPRPAIREVTGR
ncbi:MAG: DUF1059 domain-containing protein [Anaerolineae bacterium]|jgi:predicted small metal-binding protein